MNHLGATNIPLWDEVDRFFYDVLYLPHDRPHYLKARSMVGLVPLFAVEILTSDTLKRFRDFNRRFQWFIDHRPDLQRNMASLDTIGEHDCRLLAIVNPSRRLRPILERLLDENEFLSPYGIRSLSKVHAENPYTFGVNGHQHRVTYEPGESTSGMFGGNSNWRGPIWFPMNFLLVESLEKFHTYLGDDFKVECPTGSGRWMTLAEVAIELSRRLTAIFTRDDGGKRPVHGESCQFQNDPRWRDLLLFYEYFHGDSGRGLGANHQTGWTGLVATLIDRESRRL